VVVNMHVHVTLRLVAPLTVALSISVVPTITLVEPAGTTATVTTFAPLLLPQPLNGHTQAARNKIPR
jgi:hypothetical protein